MTRSPSPAATQMVHQKYRPDIDGLRACAVLSVLFFHAFHDVVSGGFIGVDVFFVISGFLISSIIFQNLARGSFSFVDFYVRRIKRIFPALILVLLACYAVGWLKLFPADFMALGRHIVAGALFVSNFALWQEAGYFDAASTTKPLLHLWSLAIEEQFYLLWPVLAYALHRLKIGFFSINILIVLGSFGTGIYLIQSDPTAAFYSPLSRFWEIGIGSALAWLMFRHEAGYRRFTAALAARHRWLSLDDFLSVTGCAALVFSLWYFDSKLKFPGYWALLPTLGTALVIAAGPGAWLNKHLLGSRPAVWVGLISYPIYLWHWPLLTALHLSEAPLVAEYPVATRFGVVALSILLAWLSYRLLETPIKLLPRPKFVATAILLAMLGMGATGAYTYAKEGIVSRIPIELREWAAITNVYGFFKFSDEIREAKCHLGSKMAENFQRPPECFSDRRPLLMLWGDSYAAALYPGLKALSERAGFGIDQVTVGNAPPFFDATKTAADNKSLAEDNELALEIARRARPEVIVMSWMVMGMNGVPVEQSPIQLADTLKKIREATPSSQVILVGPVPLWEKKLVDIVVDYLRTKPMGSSPEQYSSFGLRPEPRDWDRQFATTMPGIGVTYISAYAELCNEKGCLTHLGSGPMDLTAVDDGHLTPAASEYLIERIGDRIVAAMQPARSDAAAK